jgi:hypothetical protein
MADGWCGVDELLAWLAADAARSSPAPYTAHEPTAGGAFAVASATVACAPSATATAVATMPYAQAAPPRPRPTGTDALPIPPSCAPVPPTAGRAGGPTPTSCAAGASTTAIHPPATACDAVAPPLPAPTSNDPLPHPSPVLNSGKRPRRKIPRLGSSLAPVSGSAPPATLSLPVGVTYVRHPGEAETIARELHTAGGLKVVGLDVEWKVRLALITVSVCELQWLVVLQFLSRSPSTPGTDYSHTAGDSRRSGWMLSGRCAWCHC